MRHPSQSMAGVPRGIRTPVTAVKGRCPGPLDDGDTEKRGGARRDRTADLLHAMQALSQLSYGPTRARQITVRCQVCQVIKSNRITLCRNLDLVTRHPIRTFRVSPCRPVPTR